MRLEAVHPVLMVRDVPRATRFYESLGFTLRGQDDPREPRYAAVARDAVELHLQWYDAKEWDAPTDRPTYRFLVHDVDGLHDEFHALNGLQFYRPR